MLKKRLVALVALCAVGSITIAGCNISDETSSHSVASSTDKSSPAVAKTDDLISLGAYRLGCKQQQSRYPQRKGGNGGGF